MPRTADLARYAPVLRRLRAMKPYQLSDEMEKFLHDLGVVGDAWERLFDETIAGLTFTVEGEEMGIEATLTLLTDHDRAKREAAARELARVLGENLRTFARVHNTQTKEKEVLDRWRGMPSAQMGRHLSQRCRARGRRGAARGGGRGLSAPVAPLLRVEAQMAGARADAGLGPQRAAADGGPAHHSLGRGARDGDGGLCRVRPANGRAGRAVLRAGLDRRGREAGQGPRRLCPPHRHRRAPLT